MTEYASVNISLPEDVIEEIEHRRGDVPRSRFIAKILQKSLGLAKKKEAVL